MVAQLETPALNLSGSLPDAVEGQVQVYTGPHRCFFTSVMAQALRMAGQGTSVLVIQFLKGGINQGYEHPVRLGQNLEWVRCNLPRCIDTPQLDEAEILAVRQLWRWTQDIISEGRCELVVLDELSLAVTFGLVPEAEVLALLEKRPRHVDIILTGPEMSSTLLDAADQVTEFRRSHRL